jgi:dipeptide transport system ATP-binding protein
MVMYLGRAVEHGSKRKIFDAPMHPYTIALLASTPHIDPSKRKRRIALKGELPSPLKVPPGCAFAARCPYAIDHCRDERPELRSVDGRAVACHRAEEIAQL